MATQITDLKTAKVATKAADLLSKKKIPKENLTEPPVEPVEEELAEPLPEQKVVDLLLNEKLIEKVPQKTNQIYSFQGVLKDRNDNLLDNVVVTLQYLNTEKLEWVSLANLTTKGGFKFDCKDEFGDFPSVPLFRLVNYNSRMENKPLVYQYGGAVSVTKVSKLNPAGNISVDFGEISVLFNVSNAGELSRTATKDLPSDKIDHAFLIGFPSYLLNFINQMTPLPKEVIIDEPEDETPIEYVNTNPNAVRIPKLIGLTETACSQLILAMGLRLDSVYQSVFNDAIANGQAIKQSAPVGSYLIRGESITVVFAKKSI